MSFKDVVIVDPYVDKGWTPEIRLTQASDKDVDQLEETFGIGFPDGYRDYVTTLGLGEYCNYIRIAMPDAIMSGCPRRRNSSASIGFGLSGRAFSPRIKP